MASSQASSKEQGVHAELRSHVEGLQHHIDQYDANGDEASKKALIDYAQQTFTPATRSWLDKQHQGTEVSQEHLSTLEGHFHELSEHLKDEEGKFDLAMARLNNNAVFNFLERLFS